MVGRKGGGGGGEGSRLRKSLITGAGGWRLISTARLVLHSAALRPNNTCTWCLLVIAIVTPVW